MIICINIDINECDVGTDNCHPNATCMDNVGSFECSCNSGFTGSGTECVGKCLIALCSSVVYVHVFVIQLQMLMSALLTQTTVIIKPLCVTTRLEALSVCV